MLTSRMSMAVIGEKKSFLIRALIGKLNDNGIKAVYVASDVDAIYAVWSECSVLAYYMEAGENISSEVLRFITDKVVDDEKQFILIGDETDTKTVSAKVTDGVIYQIFNRPLNNEVFVNTISDLMRKLELGEFKKRILIVDDDPNYISLVREWLKDTYKVSMVASGLQAIKWLGKNTVDLILLDFEMPVTSGPQVLEMLRSEDETRSIPVIFLTGKGDKESVMEVVALKPEGYFLKTIKKEELMANLNEFFAKRK